MKTAVIIGATAGIGRTALRFDRAGLSRRGLEGATLIGYNDQRWSSLPGIAAHAVANPGRRAPAYCIRGGRRRFEDWQQHLPIQH